MSGKDFEILRLMPGEQVVSDAQNFMGQIKPVKLFILPTGSVQNKPSYCLLMNDMYGGHWVAQITHQMILDAYNEFQKIKPWHDPKCDVDPATFAWKREIPKGELAYICSSCTANLTKINLNARRGSTAESTAKE
jgi:hypothetical protein